MITRRRFIHIRMIVHLLQYDAAMCGSLCQHLPHVSCGHQVGTLK